MLSALDPNNSVIKRLWGILKSQEKQLNAFQIHVQSVNKYYGHQAGHCNIRNASKIFYSIALCGH